jgi:type II secretory pathway component PulJ
MRQARTTTSRRGSRGFMLVEVLLVCALLGVVALLAVRLMRRAVQIESMARGVQDESAKIDQFVTRLRGDVWGCESIHVAADGRSVELPQPGGASITWTVDQAGQTRRVATKPDEQAKWNAFRSPPTFVARGPGMLVVGFGGRIDRRIILVSQECLAEAKP